MKLLIKNARIIDPAAGRDSVGDIAVEGMRIALPSAAENYDSIFDGTGYLVTPGLIDFHLHLFDAGQILANARIVRRERPITSLENTG